MPEARVKVIAVDIGGGFGNKQSWAPEVVAALASMLTGRPVKWFEDRRGNIMAGPHNRDYTWEGEIAVKRDGTIIGYRAKLIVDIGVEGNVRGNAGVATMVAAAYTVGPLRYLKGAEVEVFNVVTNKSYYGAYRGFGKDLAQRFLGRAFYAISRELKIPVEKVIERNVLHKEDFPFKTILGPHYDSGDFPALLAKAMKKYEELKEKKRKLISEGKLAGIGITVWIEPSGAAIPGTWYHGTETARVVIHPEGHITVYTGIKDLGQGVESTIAQVAAEILGVRMDEIRVVEGESDIAGMGSWSSRGAVYSVSAVAKASRILRERVLKTAANIWKANPEDLDIKDGEVYKKDEPSKRISIYEIARMGPLAMPEDLIERGEITFDVTVHWFSPLTAKDPFATYTTHVSGADVALVVIDPETYEIKVVDYYMVHDAGRLINPAIVDAQLHGGIVQGVGGALYEELIYDESGQLLNPSYTDYLMPTAMETPNIEVDHIETPSPFTELGTKGMGEGGPISAQSAILGAIEDALSQYGVIEEAPVTPDRLLKLLKKVKE